MRQRQALRQPTANAQAGESAGAIAKGNGVHRIQADALFLQQATEGGQGQLGVLLANMLMHAAHAVAHGDGQAEKFGGGVQGD